jgi:hypothetical protein
VGMDGEWEKTTSVSNGVVLCCVVSTKTIVRGATDARRGKAMHAVNKVRNTPHLVRQYSTMLTEPCLSTETIQMNSHK